MKGSKRHPDEIAAHLVWIKDAMKGFQCSTWNMAIFVFDFAYASYQADGILFTKSISLHLPSNVMQANAAVSDAERQKRMCDQPFVTLSYPGKDVRL